MPAPEPRPLTDDELGPAPAPRKSMLGGLDAQLFLSMDDRPKLIKPIKMKGGAATYLLTPGPVPPVLKKILDELTRELDARAAAKG